MEDNPTNQELIAQRIARHPDRRLPSAADGNRGIELPHAHQPQVIVMNAFFGPFATLGRRTNS